MNRIFRLTLGLIAASAAVYQAFAGCEASPDSGCRPSPHLMGHYMTIGGAIVDNSAVGDRVESLGYTGFSRYALSLGFGGFRRYGRYVSGGEIEGLAWKPNRGELFSSFSVGRLVLLHGISLLSSPGVALYPLVGVGMGMSSLKVKRNATDFNAALNAPPLSTMHSETVNQMTMLIDLGVGFQLARPVHPGSQVLKTIGLRAGYMIDPLDNETWRRGDAVLNNGPHSNLSGPYLKLTMGKSGHNRTCGADDRCTQAKRHCCAASCPSGKEQGTPGACCPQMKNSCKAAACPHMMGGYKNSPHPRPEGAVGDSCGMKPSEKK